MSAGSTGTACRPAGPVVSGAAGRIQVGHDGELKFPTFGMGLKYDMFRSTWPT